MAALPILEPCFICCRSSEFSRACQALQEMWSSDSIAPYIVSNGNQISLLVVLGVLAVDTMAIAGYRPFNPSGIHLICVSFKSTILYYCTSYSC